jgi:hypothetical protein
MAAAMGLRRGPDRLLDGAPFYGRQVRPRCPWAHLMEAFAAADYDLGYAVNPTAGNRDQ